MPRGEQSALATLFGAWTEVVHGMAYWRSQWQGQQLTGFWADLSISDAETLACFDDGRPAITRKKHGNGGALLIAFDPSSVAVKPDQPWAEDLIGQLAQALGQLNGSNNLAQTIRRQVEEADHYYFINFQARRPRPGYNAKPAINQPVMF